MFAPCRHSGDRIVSQLHKVRSVTERNTHGCRLRTSITKCFPEVFFVNGSRQKNRLALITTGSHLEVSDLEAAGVFHANRIVIFGDGSCKLVPSAADSVQKL